MTLFLMWRSFSAQDPRVLTDEWRKGFPSDQQPCCIPIWADHTHILDCEEYACWCHVSRTYIYTKHVFAFNLYISDHTQTYPNWSKLFPHGNCSTKSSLFPSTKTAILTQNLTINITIEGSVLHNFWNKLNVCDCRLRDGWLQRLYWYHKTS